MSIRSRTSSDELALVGVQVRLQLLQVGAPRLQRAEAAQPQLHPGHAELAEQVGEQHDRLGVGQRRVGPDRLGAELVELAVAARLRALVAEERAEVGELHRLRQLVHPVLEVGAADRRRPLRPQGQAAPALVLEGEHLLADDVGGAADAALEQLGVLEGRRRDRLVAGAGEDRRGGALDPRPRAAPARAARRRSRGVPGTCWPWLRRPYSTGGRSPTAPASRGTGWWRARRPASSSPCGRDRRRSRPEWESSRVPIDSISVGPSPPGRSTRPTEPWKRTSPEKIASSPRTE